MIIYASLQLSSRCWPPSRTLLRSASPESWAPLAQVGPQPPPPLACLRPPQLLQRPWCKLPPVPVLALALLHRCPNGHRGAAPAPAQASVALVMGLAVKSCPPVPPAQLRLSRAVPPQQPGGFCTLCTSLCGFPRFRRWDALLDAHGLAPPPDSAAAAVAQPANAAGASRRARDKRRRRLRKASKRSMWREI